MDEAGGRKRWTDGVEGEGDVGGRLAGGGEEGVTDKGEEEKKKGGGSSLFWRIST